MAVLPMAFIWYQECAFTTAAFSGSSWVKSGNWQAKLAMNRHGKRDANFGKIFLKNYLEFRKIIQKFDLSKIQNYEKAN
jgi:hypothetical protein